MPRTGKRAADLAFSNLGKIFFPAGGFTKGDLIKYYLEVAPVMLPHLRDRPVTMIRMPDGVTGERFYEKNAPRHAPDWVQTTQVPRSEGGVIHYILVNDARTLAWCANLGTVEFHPFLHRAGDIARPTHLAFDLDPGEGADLLTCIEVGFLIRAVLAGLASHLHYDFRLELEGVLKSWAVPKGLSTERGVKRSAFETEDHPLEYIHFEGTIPPGQYGGGTVMVWDRGEYEVLRGDHAKGDLKLLLHGRKLKGEWHIFRIKSDESKPLWLVMKSGESARPVSARQEDRSVVSGRSMQQIARAGDAVWQSSRA